MVDEVLKEIRTFSKYFVTCKKILLFNISMSLQWKYKIKRRLNCYKYNCFSILFKVLKTRLPRNNRNFCSDAHPLINDNFQ